jgi:hypothetical protein
MSAAADTIEDRVRPHSDRIPPWASARLRRFKVEIADPSLAIESVLRDDALTTRLFTDALLQNGFERRAPLLVSPHFPGARIATLKKPRKIISVMWLAPMPKMLDSPNPTTWQDCVLVFFALAWKSGRKIAQFWVQWALEAPDHALHRMIQREVDHRREPDLRTALFAAATAFLRADANVLNDYGHDSNICLPAGPGLLACNVIKSHDRTSRIYTYARARTYLSPEQLARNPGQDAVSPASDLANSVLNKVLDEVPFETELVHHGALIAAPPGDRRKSWLFQQG